MSARVIKFFKRMMASVVNLPQRIGNKLSSHFCCKFTTIVSTVEPRLTPQEKLHDAARGFGTAPIEPRGTSTLSPYSLSIPHYSLLRTTRAAHSVGPATHAESGTPLRRRPPPPPLLSSRCPGDPDDRGWSPSLVGRSAIWIRSDPRGGAGWGTATN